MNYLAASRQGIKRKIYFSKRTEVRGINPMIPRKKPGIPAYTVGTMLSPTIAVMF